ncbi:hypothetical protein CPB86DRAFT_624449 [Serendipita vermifera]|nr:hypothetical protein CPB86DRAFT_624449 [Serendipita vermifera]
MHRKVNIKRSKRLGTRRREFYSAPFVTAVIAILVQSFFALRYWRLTRRLYICMAISFGMALSFVASIINFTLLFKLRTLPVNTAPPSLTAVSFINSLEIWSLIHFITAIIVDVTITSATAWHLYKQKPFATRSTSQMIDRLIRMVWQSALPPT